MKRILIVCHEINSCDRVLQRGVELAKDLDAHITVLFVHEVALFDFFGKEQPFDAQETTALLQQKLAKLRGEDVALLVKIGDSADLIEQETQAEDDTLIVMGYLDDFAANIVKRVKTPVLVLKSFNSKPSCGVLATEVAAPKRSVDLLHALKVEKITLFMDEQVVPVAPVVDPMADFTYSGIEEEVYVQQLLQMKEDFEDFCKQSGLECAISEEDESLSVNIVAFASEKGADLLALALIDSGSILVEALDDILEKSTKDILVTYEGR